jgi:hypothetical protein
MPRLHVQLGVERALALLRALEAGLRAPPAGTAVASGATAAAATGASGSGAGASGASGSGAGASGASGSGGSASGASGSGAGKSAGDVATGITIPLTGPSSTPCGS